jgi:hypothetical protein
VRILLVGLAACCFLGSPLWGQSPAYNPYAPSQDEPLPVSKDGKLNWPAFFKSKQIEDRFQSYFAMGSCVGTNQSIVNMLRDNKVDVNKLPEASLRGLATACDPRAMTVVDTTGMKTLVVTHPAGVTKISVWGQMDMRELKPGMVVRFLGRVDQRGMGTDPIEKIEVVTPGPSFRWLPVEPNRVQTITGKVVRFQGQRLQVRVDAGKMHRLTLPVANDASVSVDGNSLGLISAGDEVSTAGHTYGGAIAGGVQIVFASDITVTKALSAAKGEYLPNSEDLGKADDPAAAGKAN